MIIHEAILEEIVFTALVTMELPNNCDRIGGYKGQLNFPAKFEPSDLRQDYDDWRQQQGQTAIKPLPNRPRYKK
jgi:hypothetical protein